MEIAESNALARQCVKVWGIDLTAIAGEVAEPQIIGQ
jgi:hypothetical protein